MGRSLNRVNDEGIFFVTEHYRSKRNKDKSRCLSLTPILQYPDLCHYHGDCGYEYWNITLANPEWFPLREHTDGPCPFKGGLNQLWRNQLLAAAIEKSSDWPYQKVFFSVCHHPKNHALQKSIDAFSELLGDKNRFFSFTSKPLIDKARASKEPALCEWADWYSNLYFV